MKTIKTYLPVFSGFYGSLFQDIIDSEEEMIIEEQATLVESQIEFDYKAFK